MPNLNFVNKHFFKEKDVRILFLGLDESGKTSAIRSLKLGDISKSYSKWGFNVVTVTPEESDMVTQFMPLDYGGRDIFRPLERHYYQNTEGIVFVLDSTDRDGYVI